jgi:hypothetical protein
LAARPLCAWAALKAALKSSDIVRQVDETYARSRELDHHG